MSAQHELFDTIDERWGVAGLLLYSLDKSLEVERCLSLAPASAYQCTVSEMSILVYSFV
jgi:hypothetical protein